MFELISQHKILSALALVIIILAAWYGLDSSSAPATTSSLATTTVSGNAPGDDLVSTLLTLRTVSLSGTIFSDPLFTTFKDFTTQITPEPVGRPNPFAPLSQNAIQESATSTTARNPALFAPRK